METACNESPPCSYCRHRYLSSRTVKARMAAVRARISAYGDAHLTIFRAQASSSYETHEERSRAERVLKSMIDRMEREALQKEWDDIKREFEAGDTTQTE